MKQKELVLFVVIVIGLAVVWSIFLYYEKTALPQEAFNSVLWKSQDANVDRGESEITHRQRMIRDLVTHILPGKSRGEIEDLLGPSSTHEELRIQPLDSSETTNAPLATSHAIPDATVTDYFWGAYDWDMLYFIGKERIFLLDHRGVAMSPDDEVLLIRLDSADKFKSWYIYGAAKWPDVVGKPGNASYSPHR